MSNMTTAAHHGIFEPPAKPKLEKVTKNFKRSLKAAGMSAAEQKAAIEKQKALYAEQYEQSKSTYAERVAIWKAKPQTPEKEVEALKAVYEEKKANYKSRKEAIKEEYKAAIAKANANSDALAKKIAISIAKNKQHNDLLDLSEDLRVAKSKYDKATLSSDEIYKNHKRIKRYAAIWRDKNLYIMLIPFVLVYAIFHYMPMYGLLMAFKDYSPFKGVFGSPWAPMGGFYHFYSFFTGPYFTRLLGNTLAISILSIIFSFPLPIIFALMLNEARSKLFATSVQTISYLPHFVSTVVVAGLVVNFLSPSTGIINFMYKWITGSEQGIYFMAKPEYFRTIYITMGIWQGTGFGSILYTSALAGIDQELYEAARIDGAGRWRQMISVTIPGILPTIAIMLIMRLGNILNVGYEAIILLYQPVTYVTADIISTYVYRIGLIDGNYSLSTAVGLTNGIVALVLVYISNTVSRKVGEVGLW